VQLQFLEQVLCWQASTKAWGLLIPLLSPSSSHPSSSQREHRFSSTEDRRTKGLVETLPNNARKTRCVTSNDLLLFEVSLVALLLLYAFHGYPGLGLFNSCDVTMATVDFCLFFETMKISLTASSSIKSGNPNFDRGFVRREIRVGVNCNMSLLWCAWQKTLITIIIIEM